MQERTGNIITAFDQGFGGYHEALVIPTNMMTKKRGKIDVAVMGKGLALEASRFFGEDIPRLLAEAMNRDGGEHIYAFEIGVETNQHIICLPTKRDWRGPSDIVLIAKMLEELVALIRAMRWERVVVPRLGCGAGGLDWVGQVKPLMSRKLDDRYTVYSRE